MNNLSLYQLSTEYQIAADKLLDMDIDEQTIVDTLDGMASDIEVKAKNVAFFIRNLEASAEQIKLAEKAMSDRRKSLENKAERIKEYLKNNMQACNFTKIECEYFTLSIQKNPHRLVIDDAGKIPQHLYVYPEAPPPYPDNALIKEKLKAGEVIDGVYLVQDTRLVIK